MDHFDHFRKWFKTPRAAKAPRPRPSPSMRGCFEDDSASEDSRPSSLAGAPTVAVPTTLPEDPQTLKTIINRLRTENQQLRARASAQASRTAGTVMNDLFFFV